MPAKADAMKLGHDTLEPVRPLEERDAIDRVDERPIENDPTPGGAGAAGATNVAWVALKLPYVGAIVQSPPDPSLVEGTDGIRRNHQRHAAAHRRHDDRAAA
jgi:hypothetical protein